MFEHFRIYGTPHHLGFTMMLSKNPEGKNFRKLLRRKQSSAKISHRKVFRSFCPLPLCFNLWLFPEIAGHPSHSLSKTTEVGAQCIDFLAGSSQAWGRGYPGVWVPDVPGISCPKTLPLGKKFVLIVTNKHSPKTS